MPKRHVTRHPTDPRRTQHTAGGVRGLIIALQWDGVTRIVIDPAPVTYMDNAALGVIVWTRRRLSGVGGRLTVAAASDPLTRMFRLTGLTRIMPVHRQHGTRSAQFRDPPPAGDSRHQAAERQTVSKTTTAAGAAWHAVCAHGGRNTRHRG